MCSSESHTMGSTEEICNSINAVFLAVLLCVGWCFLIQTGVRFWYLLRLMHRLQQVVALWQYLQVFVTHQNKQLCLDTVGKWSSKSRCRTGVSCLRWQELDSRTPAQVNVVTTCGKCSDFFLSSRKTNCKSSCKTNCTTLKPCLASIELIPNTVNCVKYTNPAIPFMKHFSPLDFFSRSLFSFPDCDFVCNFLDKCNFSAISLDVDNKIEDNRIRQRSEKNGFKSQEQLHTKVKTPEDFAIQAPTEVIVSLKVSKQSDTQQPVNTEHTHSYVLKEATSSAHRISDTTRTFPRVEDDMILETKQNEKTRKAGDFQCSKVIEPGKNHSEDYVATLRNLTSMPLHQLPVPKSEISVHMLPAVQNSGRAMAGAVFESHRTSSTPSAMSGDVVCDGRHGHIPNSPSEMTETVVASNPLESQGHVPTQTAAHSDTFNTSSLNQLLEQLGKGETFGPRVTMKYELLRLCTLRNYPKENKPYIIRLAGAGFYYAASGDEVVCYCCGVRRSGWTANCNPRQVHERISPYCSFLTRNSEVNVPVPQLEAEGQDKFANLRELLETPVPGDVSGEDQVLASRYTSGSQQNQAPQETSAYSAAHSQPIVCNKTPKHPHYAVKSVRLQSFVGWPADAKQQPEILAEAGFYFAGIGDCVRCFHCGVGLRHWDVDDNPWIEHGRWTLEEPCHYLVQYKGEEFLRLIRMALDITQNQPSQDGDEQTPEEPPISQEEVSRSESVVYTSASSGGASNTVDTSKSQSEGAKSGKPGKKQRRKKGNKQANVTTNTDNTRAGQKASIQVSSEQKKLKEENTRLRSQTVCKVCEERDVCIVFLPCGHLVTCAECAPTLRVCPICQGDVKGTVKTYMA